MLLPSYSIVLPSPLFESIGLICVASFALIVTILEAALRERLAWLRFWLPLLGLTVSFLLTGWLWIVGNPFSYGVLIFDRFAYFFALIIIAASWFAIFEERGYRSFILLSASGALLMVHARELVTIYLGVELATIPLIFWIGFNGKGLRSQEANIKYYLMFGVASAFLLYGIALLYSATGTTSLAGIREATLSDPSGRGLLFILGTLLMMVGLAFKLACVPFHFSSPDIYEGGSTPAASLVAVTAKVAGMAALLRLLNDWWHVPMISWQGIFWAGALLSLIVGHLQALPQSHIKRLVAYGSIGHAGFLLLGLAAASASSVNLEKALAGILFYLIAYSLMILGIFAIVLAMEVRGEGADELADYAGLARRHPWLAASMALFLLSSAGFPATIGFAAKFYILAAGLKAGLFGLVAIAIATSLVAAYCYLEIIVAMYFKEREIPKLPPLSYSLLTVLVLCTLATLYWGLFPTNLLVMAGESVRSLVF